MKQQRPTFQLRRWIVLLVCFGALLAFPTPPSQGAVTLNSVIVTVPTGNALTVEVAPDALPDTITWGETVTFDITIRHTGTTGQIAPQLYEAYPIATSTPAAITNNLPDSLRQVQLPVQDERVDPQIATDLAAAPAAETEFLVFLADQADISAAYAIRDRVERGEYVYNTLVAHAESEQKELRSWLEAQNIAYRPFWIVNALLVRGGQTEVNALAGRAEVAMLRANHVASLSVMAPDVAETPIEPAQTGSDVEWNIAQIGADRVWQDFGVTGRGITVANIDSGVQYEHPALVEQYRGYNNGTTDDHNYNWFDPRYNLGTPADTLSPGHGTHVMGTMVGRGDISNKAVGVAPDASWVASVGCQKTSCWESDLIASAQWMLAPTDLQGQNPRPDLRPHVVNNSWAGPGANDFYLAYTTAWRAAGIFPVFVSGNYGNSQCNTVGSPGDYSNVIAVGATNSQDNIASYSGIGPSFGGTLKPDLVAPGEGIVSTYATQLYGTNRGTSMAAPHVAGAIALLWSANPDLIGNYDATYNALVNNAFPITDSAFSAESKYTQCRAESVPNNIYGFGRLDVYQAMAAAKVDIPWLKLASGVPVLLPQTSVVSQITIDTANVPGPGTYTGRVLVSDGDLSKSPIELTLNITVADAPATGQVAVSVVGADTGQPLSGYLEVDDGFRIALNEASSIPVTLPARAEPYQIGTDVLGYIDQSETITVTADSVQNLSFTLGSDISNLTIQQIRDPDGNQVPSIQHDLAFGQPVTYTVEILNAGTQPLNFKVRTPPEDFGVWRSDQPADNISTQWVSIPGVQSTIELADNSVSSPIEIGFDFPFYNKMYNEVYVSSNGMLSFEAFTNDVATGTFTEGCLPVPETYRTVIAPLRADLNPAGGGAVSWAQTAAGFVVTFENVPLQQTDTVNPGSVTFQVVLLRNGHIRYNYQQIEPLPRVVGVGLQNSSIEGQAIGCDDETTLTNNLTLELRPQPNSLSWVDVEPRNTQLMLEPGQTMDITVGLTWARGTIVYPYRTTALLENADARQSTFRLPVEVNTLAAPSTHWLPHAGNAPRAGN